MSSWASLYIGNYCFISQSQDVDDIFASIFAEIDKVKEAYYDEDYEEESTRISYKSNSFIVKRRLEIMGYDLETLEENFNEIKNSPNQTVDLKNFSFMAYLESLQIFYESFVDCFNQDSYDEITPEQKAIIRDFHLKEEGALHPLLVLRGLLEKIEDTIEVDLDISDLVNAGYYDEEAKLTERKPKTIIIAEGTSDIEIIKSSLDLLYPEYADYFSFLELIEEYKIELNASTIVKYAKSFMSAGFRNSMIIIFDNDAEGVYNLSTLLKYKVPNNFRIKTYPDLEIAKNYPVICPTGVENLDVNGAGCSIELYLGKEALSDKDGNLMHMQVKSFNAKINKYQISFSDSQKESIKKKYMKILNLCLSDREKIECYDFENIKLLLENIFTAFDGKIMN